MGINVREYGELTPRELFLIVDEYNDRTQKQREDMLTSAYLTAFWQRTKKMPSLKKILEDAKPKKLEPQTSEQMFDVVKLLQTQFGREGD